MKLQLHFACTLLLRSQFTLQPSDEVFIKISNLSLSSHQSCANSFEYGKQSRNGNKLNFKNHINVPNLQNKHKTLDIKGKIKKTHCQSEINHFFLLTGPKLCPLIVSFAAVCATLLVTMSVLFWNYSETRQRRLTKKQSIILDHWGKTSPLLEKKDLDSLLEGGETYYGETALRKEFFLSL